MKNPEKDSDHPDRAGHKMNEAKCKPKSSKPAIEIDPEFLLSEPAWPEPIHNAAYYGLAGDFVKTVEPHTESDPVALLIQYLIVFGNILGQTAYWKVEADTHFLNEYAVLVGETSRGRKGTSLGQVKEQFRLVDEKFVIQNLKTGLSSGEGLKYAIRDAEDSGKKNADPGVSDKRLLVIEPEFANVLRVCKRNGNTLSATIRQLWDTGNVRNLTKQDPIIVTGGHVSIIGHITGNELREFLATLDQSNGFANRFLWLVVRRSKKLPLGGNLAPSVMGPLADRLRKAISFATSLCDKPIGFDPAAEAVWFELYSHLTRDIPGLMGAMLSRAEAHARRLACLYALLDCSGVVRTEHLEAAAAIIEHLERSVRYIFGNQAGLYIADEILEILKKNPRGMSRTEISNALGRNVQSATISSTLSMLSDIGKATMTKTETGGRPIETWKYRNGVRNK